MFGDGYISVVACEVRDDHILSLSENAVREKIPIGSEIITFTVTYPCQENVFTVIMTREKNEPRPTDKRRPETMMTINQYQETGLVDCNTN